MSLRKICINKHLIFRMTFCLFLAACKNTYGESLVESPISTAGPDAINQFIDDQSEFTLVSSRIGSYGERRELVSFKVSGLQEYALLLWPKGEPPIGGWPLLIFNHGYHPEPPKYGVRSNGKVDRPGDYYWDIPQSFVESGFVVLAPDYRGHNISEGLAYTASPQAVNWYVDDVLSSYFAAIKLPNINQQRVYMLGHSMGGAVTQLALPVLGDRIKAASIWSAAKATAIDGNNSYNNKYHAGLSLPMHIHHAIGDKTTAVSNSEYFYQLNKNSPIEPILYLYPSSDHLFKSKEFNKAVERDLQLFQSTVLNQKGG